MRTTWKIGEDPLIDVTEVLKRTPDPEAHLFEKERRWVLVVSADALMHVDDWNDDTVAFICVEAIRERSSATAWERRARGVFFVRRDDIARLGLVEGPITGSHRYRLRDLAADPELSPDGSVV